MQGRLLGTEASSCPRQPLNPIYCLVNDMASVHCIHGLRDADYRGPDQFGEDMRRPSHPRVVQQVESGESGKL